MGKGGGGEKYTNIYKKIQKKPSMHRIPSGVDT